MTTIRNRRGTSAEWTSANPTLAVGEIGYDTTVDDFKIGNGTSTWAALAFRAAAVQSNYGYLVATFGGNGIYNERLSLYYSADGTAAVGGSNNTVYTPASTGNSLRDPSMVNINDIWYCAYTANNGYSKTLEIVSSTDLLTWTLLATINVAAATNLNQSWAPEIVQDTNGDVYLFFANVTAANATSMWYVKATNAALSTWGSPIKLPFTVDPSFAIDGAPIKKGSTWYLFYSNLGVIHRATASSVVGTYTIDKTGDWAGWGSGIEGPCVVLIDGTTYRMYVDKYSLGTGYSYSESTDLNTWTALKPVVMGRDTAQGQLLRHGSFVRLTSQSQMLEVLQATMGVAQVPRYVEYDQTPGAQAPNNTVWGPGMPTVSSRTTDTMFCHWSANDELTFDADGVYQVEWMCSWSGGGVSGRTFFELQDKGRLLPYARQGITTGEDVGSVGTTAYMGIGGIMKFTFMQNTGAARTVRHIIKVHRMTSS